MNVELTINNPHFANLLRVFLEKLADAIGWCAVLDMRRPCVVGCVCATQKLRYLNYLFFWRQSSVICWILTEIPTLSPHAFETVSFAMQLSSVQNCNFVITSSIILMRFEQSGLDVCGARPSANLRLGSLLRHGNTKWTYSATAPSMGLSGAYGAHNDIKSPSAFLACLDLKNIGRPRTTRMRFPAPWLVALGGMIGRKNEITQSPSPFRRSIERQVSL